MNPEQAQLRWWLTARNSTNRLTEQAPLASAEAPYSAGRVWVDSNKRFQTHLGFGGAFTESAAVNWVGLSAPERAKVLSAYFDAQHGHGYNLCRVHINSCDFSLGNYAHVPQAGDTALQSFSIARDREALIPSSRQRSESPSARCCCWPRPGVRRPG